MNARELIKMLEDKLATNVDGMIEVVTDEGDLFNVVTEEELARGEYDGQAAIRFVPHGEDVGSG